MTVAAKPPIELPAGVVDEPPPLSVVPPPEPVLDPPPPLPPVIVVESKTTPADMRFKKVGNIPAKYHSTGTSRLTAAVRVDKVVHDFDMNLRIFLLEIFENRIEHCALARLCPEMRKADRIRLFRRVAGNQKES